MPDRVKQSAAVVLDLSPSLTASTPAADCETQWDSLARNLPHCTWQPCVSSWGMNKFPVEIPLVSGANPSQIGPANSAGEAKDFIS